MDAMHCQKETLQKAIDNHCDYIVGVKGNQKKLLESIRFNTSVSDPVDTHTQSVLSRNRIEKRTVELYNDLYAIEGWPGLKSIIKVTRSATIKGKKSHRYEEAYFISSLEKPASFFQHAIRGHWMIENALHYVKVVTFGEDKSTIRTGHAPTNFSIVFSIAMTAYGKKGYKSFPQAIRKNAFKIGKLMKLLGC